jgi:hypothetical protein
MSSRILPLVLALATAAAPCAAQRRASADLSSARLSAAPSASLAPDPAPRQLASPAAARNHSPALGALGGALVGGAMTWLISQVAWNDWDASDNADFSSRRMVLTAGGSALGAIGGALLAHRSGGHAVGRGGAFNAQVITQAEIRQSRAVNAYDVVHALRPHWLRETVVTSHPALNPDPTAGAGGAARTPADQGRAIPSTPQPTEETEPAGARAEEMSNPGARRGVRVYVERNLVGDVNALRDIEVSTITSIEFLDTATAAYRLGMGNPSGAIVVHITPTGPPVQIRERP